MGWPHTTLGRVHRLSFAAGESIYFPEGKSANTLRGAFGTILRRIAAEPEYIRLFAPVRVGPALSGFHDRPRPFVFRANHMDGRTIEAGQSFHFDMHWFDLKTPLHAYLSQTFAQLASDGLGLGRKKVELLSQKETPILVAREMGEVSKMMVRFVTPTELKSESKVVSQPEFGILAARVRDRLTALRELYGAGSPALDFKAFGQRAALVRMTRCQVHPVSISRRSSRTGQVHSIGGFVGDAEYEGKLTEFVPWLKAAYWTGVGRQTVWGKGVIETLILE